MAKFFTGNELNSELEKLFERADEQIILISPYIRLHDRYASVLRTKINNPKIAITIVFGKNEEDLSRSMKQDDFNFFKEFPNIEIRYEKRLHAKYYSSESSAMLTSMNLYNFSQDNNIEAGVMTKATLLGDIASNILTNVTGEDSFDKTASIYFQRVIEQSDLLFKKVPEYESVMLGLSKKYKSSKTEVDLLTDFFANRPKYDSNNRKVNSENKPIATIHASTEIKPDIKAEPKSTPQIFSDTKFHSATSLSKMYNVSKEDIIKVVESAGLINGNKITSAGQAKGLVMKKHMGNDYIAFPENLAELKLISK